MFSINIHKFSSVFVLKNVISSHWIVDNSFLLSTTLLTSYSKFPVIACLQLFTHKKLLTDQKDYTKRVS